MFFKVRAVMCYSILPEAISLPSLSKVKVLLTMPPRPSITSR